ncbi:desulfoferrodoxin family protein [uncultured Desulfobacter sp.]|uniref:desulfoferrodoxin family protein n=1 Tax=uncultured Desulfobacter sp. TaxID=240139 RepID=UPI0029F4FB85|nr:desulfoferrodoxin family protein [uncultured Desulfobacter sp.]
MHHVNWVVLKADGKEIARWDFSAFNRPESGTFSKEVDYTISGPVELTAEANCNMHGSTGPVIIKIPPKQQP